MHLPVDSTRAYGAGYLPGHGSQSGAGGVPLFKLRWQTEYPTMVKQLEKDLPDLLAFFGFPKHLWKQLRTTDIIERCFVEVR